jgi:DnaJ like chaperone protein
MNWTGKAVGAGLGALILGPAGAAVGGIVGHWFDENRGNQIPEDVRWRQAILSIYATAAAAKGEFHPKKRKRLQVLAHSIFEGYPPECADRWLSLVEQVVVPLQDCGYLLRQLPNEAQQRVILDMLSVFYADGTFDEAERSWLQQMVQCSGMNPNLWIQCLRFFERDDTKPQRAEALGVLGLSGDHTDHEIKLAYRQACLEYHPDRLGHLSAPIQRLAEEKLQKLNAAYESLQSDGKGQALFVMTTGREVNRLADASEREVVLCPLCETQNRLPGRKHHNTCRCGVCHALLAMPEEFFSSMSTLSGWYVGTCTNRTVSLSANMLIVIHGATGSTIHGELGLSGDLGGGGPFHGSIHEGEFVFTTCAPANQTVIEWRGELSENPISGTYSVVCDHPERIAEGLGRQEGIWACSFIRSLGAIDPEKSDLVWVFDNGETEGPIATREFNQRAASGRWPAKAIVAMQDRTLWMTIAEFLNTKRATAN